MVIVIAGLALTSTVMRESITDSMNKAYAAWTTPSASTPSP
jgi:hypothetical protein